MTVLAVDEYRSNAELIAAAARLGHLDRQWATLDCTYGRGVFWQTFRPDKLVCSDLRPSSPHVQKADFRRLPWAARTFRAVVLDPPYGLRGAINDTNGGYGLVGYMPVAERHDMIRAGITEAARVVTEGGRVLVKCQDQVCSGKVWWQTRIFADHAESVGLELVERLDMLGHRRPQPPRKRLDGKPSAQQHAYGRPSSLLIFRRKES